MTPVLFKRETREVASFLCLSGALLFVPLTGVYPVFVMQMMCYALFACAFNLLLGYGGLLSFGQAMFLGTGGYVAGHILKVWGAPPELGLMAGVVCASALAFATGVLAIRRQGIYFAMITLALSQLVFFVVLRAPFTGGENGLQGVPPGVFFGVLDLSHGVALYYVVLAVFSFAVLGIRRVINSPFGEVLKAIRENETRASSLEYQVNLYKLTVFVLSGGIAGLAGGLKVIVTHNASLTDADWSTSGEVALMTILGGIGTGFGPIVGAVIILGMQQYLSVIGQWYTVVQGAIFVACVLAFRRGIVGEIAVWLRQSRFNRRPSVKAAAV